MALQPAFSHWVKVLFRLAQVSSLVQSGRRQMVIGYSGLPVLQPMAPQSKNHCPLSFRLGRRCWAGDGMNVHIEHDGSPEYINHES
mmetsp:Transcript_6316/g.10664  ORF Transcript_6316/g.10664 Transcript_6316/m.10664 type:complete len:86 (+) Transcript_6316:2171-2428(+)